MKNEVIKTENDFQVMPNDTDFCQCCEQVIKPGEVGVCNNCSMEDLDLEEDDLILAYGEDDDLAVEKMDCDKEREIHDSFW